MTTAAELRALLAVAHRQAGHAVVSEELTGEQATITIAKLGAGPDAYFRGRCLLVEPLFEEGRHLVRLAGPVAEAVFLQPDASAAELRRLVARISVSDAPASLGESDRIDTALRFVTERRATIAARAELEAQRYFQTTPGRRGGGEVDHFPRRGYQ